MTSEEGRCIGSLLSHILGQAETMADCQNAAELVARIRALYGWSQQKLGEVLGKSRKTISRWESGKHQPKFDDAHALQVLLAKAPRKVKRA
jgi:DNA-binding XRE family transcriptional regulator